MIPKKRFTVAQLASRLGAEAIGNTSQEIGNIAPLDAAGPEDLSFLAAGKQFQRLVEVAKQGQVGALLVAAHIESLAIPQIIVPNPLVAVAGLAPLFQQVPPQSPGIHPTAIIASTARVDPTASIGAYVVVGEYAQIEENVTLYPHVVIYAGVTVGAGSVIHAHAVLRELVELGPDCLIQGGVIVGGDGFGYFPEPGVKHHRIPHIGRVVLEEGVDLGANSTVDRATLGETRIRKFTKLDNLVMVGHNVLIGERSLLCAQVGISGSTKVGSDVILAGQTGVADHLTIGNCVRSVGQTGVTSDVPDNTDVGGTPSIKAGTWRRIFHAQMQLPELLRRVKKLEKKLGIERNET